MMTAHPLIQTNNLTKYYQSGIRKPVIQALQDVSVEVYPSEIIAILGLNGAGKTTLVKLLLGLIRPTSGSGIVMNQPLGSASVRHRIGYLPEQHQYPPFLTPIQSLKLFGAFYGLSGKSLFNRIRELLEAVGLSEARDRKIQKFSKGMKQRLGLAHALLTEPDLIILDEPTEGLDPIARKEIRELLLSLQKKNKTIFLNSHILSEVEQICDRAMILKQGEIIAHGTLESIIGESLEYRIDFQGHPAQALQERFKETVWAENLVTIMSNDLECINALIDGLRTSDCLIQSVKKVQANLEDRFIKLVQE